MSSDVLPPVETDPRKLFDDCLDALRRWMANTGKSLVGDVEVKFTTHTDNGGKVGIKMTFPVEKLQESE